MAAEQAPGTPESSEKSEPAPAVEPAAPHWRGRALVALAGTAVVALVADVLTKVLAVNALSDEAPVRLLGGAVYLTLVRNSGAAFSLGTGYTWVFPLITIGVVAWIAWVSRRLRSMPWAVALGLVLGGALGNLSDRIFRAPGPMRGHVIDFVSLFDPHGGVWPVFNVADSVLCCGVALAVLLELRGRRLDGTRGGRPRNADPGKADPGHAGPDPGGAGPDGSGPAAVPDPGRG